jgi:serine/threonine-protein kinase
MVLEYVHGYALSAWLEYRKQTGRPLPVDVCLFIVRRTLDALHYAHHFGVEDGHEIQIVHRDVAPDNVLISLRGFVHLLDFGVASISGPRADKSTQAGAFRGKLGYAAPETIQGHPATPRADQYSAAIVLFELLTGEALFMAESMGETIVRMVNQIPEPASSKRAGLAPELDPIIARALAKDPAQRFDSAQAFSRALRPFQQRDDEEVAQQLQELVREDFKVLPQQLGMERLEARDEALARAAAQRPVAVPVIRDTQLAWPAPAQPPLPVQPPLAAQPPPPVADSSSLEDDAPPAALLEAQAPLQKQLRRLLWGLLAMGGLVALGLGAAVSLLARRSGSEQVVVVGGDRLDTVPAAQVGVPPPPASSGAPPDARGEPGPELPAGAIAPVLDRAKSGKSVPERASKSRASAAAQDEGKDLQQRLASAVQRQSDAFQDCFTVNLAARGRESSAVLHFSVAASGGAPQVNIEPAALAATPLGVCLERAGRRVQFPALANDVSFRVPVRARVTRRPEPQ